MEHPESVELVPTPPPVFTFLSDEQTLEWLVGTAGMIPDRARNLVEGCRRLARHESKPDEPRHVLGRVGSTLRLISKATHMRLIHTDEKPRPEQLEEMRRIGNFLPDTALDIAGRDDVEALVRAMLAAGISDPLGLWTVCLSTTCVAGHPLVLKCRKGTIIIGHKNFFDYGYGPYYFSVCFTHVVSVNVAPVA